MDVSRLDLSKKHEAATVFARTFFNYPQFVCYHPSQEWRIRHFTDYCEAGLNFALRYGEVYTTPDMKGIICWFSPGKTHFTTWMYLKTPGFLRQFMLISPKNLSRIFTCEEYTEKVQDGLMPDPHWYLWGFAVDPDFQGQGIGTSLMEPGLARAEQQNLPVYLETHDESNVAFYQRRGFELARSDRVPGIGLPFWCLVRHPKV